MDLIDGGKSQKFVQMDLQLAMKPSWEDFRLLRERFRFSFFPSLIHPTILRQKRKDSLIPQQNPLLRTISRQPMSPHQNETSQKT